MPVIADIGLVAIQAAQMYLTFASQTPDMTEEEAAEAFARVSARVADANKLWELAGK